jgi:HD-like signal output (HDOD) protein
LGSHHEEVIVELFLESLENPVVDLPPFPAAARRLLGAGTAAPDDDDILDVVKSDPGLAAQVIKAANSPFYMAAAPVASLGSAVVRIGLREVRRVALAAAMASTFKVDGFEPLIDTSHIHSLTAGTSAEALSKTFNIEPGVAFLAGLLHDAGELLAYRLLGRVYGQGSAEKAPWTKHLPFVRELAKKYHCYLGAMFIEPWDLPVELKASLVYHHHPYLAEDSQEELANLIHVANATADIAIRHARSDIWQQYLTRLQERREQSSTPAKAGSAGVDGIDLLPFAEIMEMLPPGFSRPRIHSIVRDILLRVAVDAIKAGHDDATTLTQH